MDALASSPANGGPTWPHHRFCSRAQQIRSNLKTKLTDRWVDEGEEVEGRGRRIEANEGAKEGGHAGTQEIMA
eukprot:6406090-Pyramimonas_sp.AAC.1